MLYYRTVIDMTEKKSIIQTVTDRALKEPWFATVVVAGLSALSSFLSMFAFVPLALVVFLFAIMGPGAALHLVCLASIIPVIHAKLFGLSIFLYLIPYAVLMFSVYLFRAHRSRHFFAESCFLIISLMILVLHILGQPLISEQLLQYKTANGPFLEKYIAHISDQVPQQDKADFVSLIFFQLNNTFFLLQIMISGMLGILMVQQRQGMGLQDHYRASWFIVAMAVFGFFFTGFYVTTSWLNPYWFLLPLVMMGILQVDRWISTLMNDPEMSFGKKSCRVVNVLLCFSFPYYMYLTAILGCVNLFTDMDHLFKKPKRRG